MSREEAMALLKETPEYLPGPCSWCAAETHEEANGKCQQYQLPCGEYECGTPNEGPNLDNETGPLYQRNAEYDRIDSYLLGWFLFDEGTMSKPPVWEGQPPQQKSMRQTLSPDAEKFNAPRHFGKDAAALVSSEVVEILPARGSKLRKAKPRRLRAKDPSE